MLIVSLNKIAGAFKNFLNRVKFYSTTNCSTLTKGGSKLTKTKSARTVKMQRQWQIDISKLEMMYDNKPRQQYRLLSHNILAQDLLVEHIHLYYNIDNRLLRWENRLTKLKEEIAQLQPDIMCLQEMQYDHLKNLVHQFSIASGESKGRKRQLEYVFKKKTGTRSDGCAIIYDRCKFKLISEQSVEYYTDGVPTLNRENIAIMAKLQILDDPALTQFIVATTHLLYNPRREDVRISQVNKLLEAITDFSRVPSFDKNSSHHRLPVILSGDFNFKQNSHPFEILTTLFQPVLNTEKSLEEKCQPVLNTVETKGEQRAMDFFQMEAIDFGRQCASTYQNKWITVDYILRSRSMRKEEKSIQIYSKYELPSEESCWIHGKIPNEFEGSDHFPLAIQFFIS